MADLINPNFPEGLESRCGKEDTRNVINIYKYWENDAIRAALDEVRTELVVLFENFSHDFNLATGVRNCNAFTVGRIFIAGRRHYDRRGTVGTHNYEHIEHSVDSVSVIERYKAMGYSIVVADNIEGAENLETFTWNPKTLVVFGQEDIGVSQHAIDAADSVVFIPQRGSVRSINVGAATGIFLYDYNSKILPES